MIKKLKWVIVDVLFINGLFRLLPDKPVIFFSFFIFWGKFPDLEYPKTFSEKIQWIKLYGNLEKYSKYVDKYDVRSYIGKIIGKKYLIPIIGIWEKFDDIDFNKLPNQFVLQATHGQGYNFICTDKSSLDREALKITVDNWIKQNYYKRSREIQYKPLKPKIICVKYLKDESGGLIDYKFFCSDGSPQVIEVISGTSLEHRLDILDIKWNKLPIFLAYPNSKKIIKKPKNLQKMIDISIKLSRIFPFVRVDLYSVNNKIYFGELTFTPGSGLDIIKPLDANYQLGKLIDIAKYGEKID